jgi:hypothetical protein
MEKLNLTNLRQMLTFFQMDDRSTVKLEGILEVVVIFVDS